MSGHRYNAKKNQGNRRYHIEDDECPLHKTRVDGERSPSATAAGEPSPAEAKEQRISRNRRKQKGRRLLEGAGWASWSAYTLVCGHRRAVGARLAHGVVKLLDVIIGRLFGRHRVGPKPYHSERDKSQGQYSRRD